MKQELEYKPGSKTQKETKKKEAIPQRTAL